MKTDKICKGCGEKIPCRAIVDGKERALGTRRFCLLCRPYNKCYQKYANLSDKRKRQMSLSVMRLGVRRKAELVRMAGGKCEQCGYDRCLKALSFHHKDPSQKKFPINARTMCKGMDIVIDEMKKCSILCLNCHAEDEARLDRERVDLFLNMRV